MGHYPNYCNVNIDYIQEDEVKKPFNQIHPFNKRKK